MSDHSFHCQARFVGRKVIQGPVNDISLSLVVTDLLGEARKSKGSSASSFVTSNIEFSDKQFLFTCIKRDEGFFESSDVESTKSCSTEEVSHFVDEQIIQDHVMVYKRNKDDEMILKDHAVYKKNKLNKDDMMDTSSANSSGTDSGSDETKSNSPTADLQKYRFDHKEVFPLSDVLFCHTDQEFRNCVVWVVRTKSGKLEALVFECSGGESEVKELYRKFLQMSKRQKLERHRRRRSDGSTSVEALFKRKSGDKSRSVIVNSSNNSNNKNTNNRASWNLVHHTDKNGITHIEVESKETSDSSSATGSTFGVRPRALGQASKSEKSKFARELENILSKELEVRGMKKAPPKESIDSHSSSASVIVSSSSNAPQKHHQKSSGESQSLRQRAPALLLKKLDELEDAAFGSNENENRKAWPTNPSKGASRTPPPPSKRHHEALLWKRQFINEPESRQKRSSSPPASVSGAIAVTASPVTVPKLHGNNNESTAATMNSNQILVPTKTGKEPVKKLYPKEPSTHQDMINRTRFIPILHPHPFLPPGQNPFTAAQPTSLPPLLPIQLSAAPIAWARYPGELHNDPNNNLGQVNNFQWASPVPTSSGASAATTNGSSSSFGGLIRGRSRDRPRFDSDARRRAQSKSPARRSVAIVANSASENGSGHNISGLTKRFREFSEAIRFKIGRKPNTSEHVAHQTSSSNQQPLALKSNLKKNQDHPDGQHAEVTQSNSDSKKVHFNKFATVQMME